MAGDSDPFMYSSDLGGTGGLFTFLMTVFILDIQLFTHYPEKFCPSQSL